METNRQKTKVFNIHLGRDKCWIVCPDWCLDRLVPQLFFLFLDKVLPCNPGQLWIYNVPVEGGGRIRVTYHAAWLLQLSHHTTPTYLLQSRFLQRTQRRENILQELDKTISNYTITLVFTKVTGCLNSGEACSTVYQKLELQFGFENLILN